MSSFKKYTILVAPLDWGLGHATRCIPIIRALLNIGHKVIIGAEGAQLILLKQEFPAIKFVELRGYRVTYSKKNIFLSLKIIAQIPSIVRTIYAENKWLKKIVEKEKIDLIIADNRFGLYHKTIPSIFITHQLVIKATFKWLEQLIQSINYKFINRFTECWVPDIKGVHNIAGILSHPPKLPLIPVQYINLLSRFQPKTTIQKYELCILLSGPEPQRSLLEEKILLSIATINTTILLVRGKPDSNQILLVPNNVTVVNHLSTHLLGEAIQQSEFILSRSGYTTIMELLALKKKMILIPTPSQTEQEYLAKNLMNLKLAISANQTNVNLNNLLNQAKAFEYKTFSVKKFDEDNLDEFIQNAVS